MTGMNQKIDPDDSEDDESGLPPLPSIIDRSTAVNSPKDNDIICGRGKSVTHPGNHKFRKLVQLRKAEYKEAKRRDEKTRIACEIVEALRNEESRFLLKDSSTGKWFDVGEAYAREKVSHALRSRPNEERRRKQRPRRNPSRKPEIPAEFDQHVQSLIQAQQELLKSMIETEVFPGTPFDTSDSNRNP